MYLKFQVYEVTTKWEKVLDEILHYQMTPDNNTFTQSVIYW